MTIKTLDLPTRVLIEFGTPDAWAVTVVNTASEVIPHWRTLGYTGALRQLEITLAGGGKDIHSGEWRVYELTADDIDLGDEGLPDDTDVSDVRIVLAVARGVQDAS